MTKKISKLFNYYLHIVEPLLSFKIYNWRVLFPVVHGGVLFISIIALTILKPVSTLILPPIFCGAMFGANLVNSALRVE